MISDVKIFQERDCERQRVADTISGRAVSWDAAEQSLELGCHGLSHHLTCNHHLSLFL